MSHYIAGGLMILMLLAVTILGLHAYEAYDTARMVDAALLDAQLKLAADGGVSPAVARLVRERLIAEGGDPDRLTIGGSRPGRPLGEVVTLEVTYAYDSGLAALVPGDARSGRFQIRRRAAAVSGWHP